MNDIPKIIYLQIGDDAEPESFSELSLSDITWCADEQFINDIAFVHKDYAVQLLKKALALIKLWHNFGRKDLQAEKDWSIYYNQSPELDFLRNFLSEK